MELFFMKEKYAVVVFLLIILFLPFLSGCSASASFSSIERDVAQSAGKIYGNEVNPDNLVGRGKGYYYLLDSRGVVIYHPKKALEGKNFGELKFVAAILAKKNGCIKGNFDNRERVIVFREAGGNILCYTIAPEYIKGDYNCDTYTVEAK
jgi:hypothetical protein